jgi:hypothetical protein
MRIIRLGWALFLVAFGALSAATLAAAEEERATAEEILDKVKQAATILAEEGGGRSGRVPRPAVILRLEGYLRLRLRLRSGHYPGQSLPAGARWQTDRRRSDVRWRDCGRAG